DVAAAAVKEATKLAPKNADVIRVTQLLQQAQNAAAAEADKMKKKAAYDQAIKQGQDLLAAKKYDEAIAQFKLAGSQMPGDPTAANLLKQAEKARNDAVGDQKKLAEYNKLMKEGTSALAA